MHRGLPEGNTKLVLILVRPWALPTLGRVFMGSFTILLHRSWASRSIRSRCSHPGFYMNAYEMPIKCT